MIARDAEESAAAQSRDSLVSVATSQLLLATHKRYAYAFYATGEQYACGAFVNIQALRDLGSGNGIRSSRTLNSNATSSNSDDNVRGSDRDYNETTTTPTRTTTTTLDFIIVTYGFDTAEIEKQASAMNVLIKKTDHLKTFKGGNYYYNGESLFVMVVHEIIIRGPIYCHATR